MKTREEVAQEINKILEENGYTFDFTVNIKLKEKPKPDGKE